ncbi:MAG: hypothetical protein DME50_08000 [Verrucomicrobia bacterium]|nr:MAG: hypothetical protein DME50_08000 [Verrucomicrobiota bacterium]
MAGRITARYSTANETICQSSPRISRVLGARSDAGAVEHKKWRAKIFARSSYRLLQPAGGANTALFKLGAGL